MKPKLSIVFMTVILFFNISSYGCLASNESVQRVDLS
jgi:hypothetical protein